MSYKEEIAEDLSWWDKLRSEHGLEEAAEIMGLAYIFQQSSQRPGHIPIGWAVEKAIGAHSLRIANEGWDTEY